MWTWRRRELVSQDVVPKLKAFTWDVAELLGQQPDQLGLAQERRDAHEAK